MATTLPTALKSAAPDVQRFATRAAQLEKFRPIVTYWCEYYILQQILARELHTSDEECTQYALHLMDKLESYKSTNATNDAVVDDVVAQAYVENFALETFSRADEAQRTNKVTKQTADTFQASTTFMDLLSIWGQPGPEIQAKLKYAKFHALRIAKAIKAGEDPNATNPLAKPPPEPETDLDEGIEAELKNLENDAGVYKSPTVENVPESGVPSQSDPALQNVTVEPSARPLGSSDNVIPTMLQPGEPDVSPIEPTDHVNSRAGSEGGGYFPAVPGAQDVASSDEPSAAPVTFPPTHPTDYYNTAPPPSATPAGTLGITSPDRPSAPTPHRMAAQTPPVVPKIYSPKAAAPVPPQVQPRVAPQAAHVQPTFTAPPAGGYKTDDESILAAQKHAKWAISALNFEDVNTAVKELRIALQNLGAS